MNKTTQKIIAIALVSLLIGLFIGKFTGGSEASGNSEVSKQEQNKEEIYTCSMHPQIRQNEPGKCPICGMDLVPVSELNQDNSNSTTTLTMSENAMALANIETYIVTQGTITEKESNVRLLGKIDLDEAGGTIELVSHIPGRIERLYLRSEGEKVFRGQKIAEVYSPELVRAQYELLEAVKMKNKELIEAAKEKLRNWKLTDNQIEAIIQSEKVKNNFTIYADRSGIIENIRVKTGSYVKTGTPLADLQNLKKLLAVFEVYEYDYSKIKLGDKIRFTTSSVPGRSFYAKVRYLEPALDEAKRVLLVKAEIQGSGRHLLRPNMLLEGELLQIKKGSKQLLIPRSAVLWTGERSVVYVKNKEASVPTFEYKEILLGEAVGDFYVVKEGLKQGDEIVVSGEFFLDSAMQLNNRSSMINGLLVNNEIRKTYRINEKNWKYMQELLEEYLLLKDALVTENTREASKYAKNIFNKLKNAPVLENQEAQAFWSEKQKHLKMHSQKIIDQPVSEQRNQFVYLSDAMVEITRAFKLHPQGGEAHIVYCPMFLEDRKAYWIAKESEVRNPYFGKKMLKCGVEEQ